MKSSPRSDTMDTALLAFDVDGLHTGRLLRPFEALVWMQALDAMLARLSCQDGQKSSCFTASPMDNNASPAPHQLLLLPISHDARHARVDHILVHAPGGFDECVVKALKQLRRIVLDNQASVVVVLVDIGTKDEFMDKVEHFGASDVWQSITPIVLFEDGRSDGLDAIEYHAHKELELHGLSACSKVEVAIERGRFLSIAAFRNALSRGVVSMELQQAWDIAHGENPVPTRGRGMPIFGLRLRFDRLVRGPIVLGQWARYGMGQFLPG